MVENELNRLEQYKIVKYKEKLHFRIFDKSDYVLEMLYFRSHESLKKNSEFLLSTSSNYNQLLIR